MDLFENHHTLCDAVLLSHNVQALETLLKRIPGLANAYGLNKAVKMGNAQMTQLLLAYGANPNENNALHIAIASPISNGVIYDLLVSFGARANLGSQLYSVEPWTPTVDMLDKILFNNPPSYECQGEEELNKAKEACLEAIVSRTCTVDEREFVLPHIAHLLEKSLAERVGLKINLQNGHLIQPFLRRFMFTQAADAMEWVLGCGIGEYDFDQAIEDEIPILCRYYNDFLGTGQWSENDHTMMMVLNKYGEIKARGYGNFARILENP